MIDDKKRVEQLQKRLAGWNADGECEVHYGESCCKYDGHERLIGLHLCGLLLEYIPEEVWGFSALQGLYLKNNQLRELPREVGELKSLEWLNLNNNKLSTLPREVGELKSLGVLSLSNNELSTLPREVGELKSLQWLILNNNELSTLPKEVEKLRWLQWLELRNNQLSVLVLPREVGELMSLKVLDLNNNKLSVLPREVGELRSLKELDLSNNQLRELPREVGELRSLEVLDLNNNKLSVLPREVRELRSLRWLKLDGNLWQMPLAEIIAQGKDAVLAYLRSLPDELDSYLASQQEDFFPQDQTLKQSANTIDIFYSYDHEDEGLRKQLERHLSPLRSQGIITDWHDRTSALGREQLQTTNSYLDTAHLILLLVSSDFLASEYRFRQEVQRAMQRHNSGEARVVPILLRPVDWKGTPFAALPVLPGNGQPVTRWPNRDDAFMDVALGIRAIVQEILAARLQKARQQMEGMHLRMGMLHSAYSQAEVGIERLSGRQEALQEERKSIEEEIYKLQMKVQNIQQELSTIPDGQAGYKKQREAIEEEAKAIRRDESGLERQAQMLREQIDTLKE